ncbi:DUF2076 domain-containing protein (plasmid) [Candidatus Pantoea edessiphila]|uniref:DUF2076 domain-containing protein n=1 Tax=Candidatus Pantoea edessiphila TaxID=2044610 RepID=A0A2P5SX93_9GAMM|nr:DUF2076 domain-containing protein [Candidatus Pantoea edessiphila]MBK4775939.1 DUF2076 domain-containing protein [Pantoea sp. Edef]PPI86944.1 DUF2076 domain-containing protein [Candidatus Pantoea edessiphila]
MQFEEKNLIEKLFQRLKKAEDNLSTRDIEAEKQIQESIKLQPAAPYYMVQSLLIQEAALNKLNQEIIKLKNDICQLQSINHNKGKTFLGKLFSRNGSSNENTTGLQSPVAENNNQVVSNKPNYNSPISPRSGGTSFMSGALQTAAGVAGGVVIGNMLSNMFHHSTPEEIVDVIEDNGSSSMAENESYLHDLGHDSSDTFDHGFSDDQLTSYDDHVSDSDFDIGNFGDDDFV